MNQNLLEYIYDKYDVQNWEILGIPIWPFVRLQLFTGIVIQKTSGENIHSLTKWKRFLGYIVKICSAFTMLMIKLFDYKHNDKTQNEVIAISGYYHLRNFRLPDGQFYDTKIDSVIELLGRLKIPCKVFEHIFSHLLFNKIKRFPRYNNTFFTSSYFFIIRLKLFFFKGVGDLELDNNCFKEYERFRQDLIERGVSGNYILSYRALCKKVQELMYLKKFFTNHLNRMTCKLGVCVADGINPINQAFFMACREQGIKTVELQHGIINGDNIVFSNWKTNGMGYINLPDYYFCWDKESADIINHWAKNTKKHHAICVGNLWHEVWKKNLGEGIQLYKNFFRTHTVNMVDKFSKIVLVSFQGDYIHFPSYLLETISTTPDILWVMRLHPLTGRKEKTRIKEFCSQNDNVYFDAGTSIPVLAWFDIIDIHVTCYSAVAKEAACFGIPTISVDESGIVENCFDDLKAGNVLHIAHNNEEFVHFVNTSRRRPPKQDNDDKYDFCEVVQNLISGLDCEGTIEAH